MGRVAYWFVSSIVSSSVLPACSDDDAGAVVFDAGVRDAAVVAVTSAMSTGEVIRESDSTSSDGPTSGNGPAKTSEGGSATEGVSGDTRAATGATPDAATETPAATSADVTTGDQVTRVDGTLPTSGIGSAHTSDEVGVGSGPTDAGVSVATSASSASLGPSASLADSDVPPPVDDFACEEWPPFVSDGDAGVGDGGAANRTTTLSTAASASRPDYERWESNGASALRYLAVSPSGGAHGVAGAAELRPELHTWDSNGQVTRELALDLTFANGVDGSGSLFTYDYPYANEVPSWERRYLRKWSRAGVLEWSYESGSMQGTRSIGNRTYVSGSRYERTGGTWLDNAVLVALNSAGQKIWQADLPMDYGEFRNGEVSANCDYAAMSGTGRSLLDPKQDVVASLYSADGERLWQACVLTDAEAWAGTFTDVIVDRQGTVVIVGRYRTSAFIQKRDVTGDVVWHRTFPDVLAWNTVVWTGAGTFATAGVDSDRQTIEVREFDLDGADRWSRTLADLSSASVNDSDVDSAGNIFLAGSSDDAGLLLRVNASLFTDIAPLPDAGIPDIAYEDPDIDPWDKGWQQSSAGGWCPEVVNVVEVEGTRYGLDHSEPDLDRIVIENAERYTLCPGEANDACSVSEDGDVAPPQLFPPYIGTPGCSFVSDIMGWKPSGCCTEEGAERLKVDTCTPELEGRRCKVTDANCYSEGVCEASVCAPSIAIECNDGLYCNGEEWCDDRYGCRSNFSPAFDDYVATADTCDEVTDIVSHAPIEAGAELCAAPAEMYVSEVREEIFHQYSYPTTSVAFVGCGETNGHCRRTENGEWFVANSAGDPLSLPVSTGCAERTWTDLIIKMGGVREQLRTEKCCVGEQPFEHGEAYGGNTIWLLP